VEEPVTIDPRAPCLIGAAQLVWRPDDGYAPEPLVLWERVARDACTQGRVDPSTIERLDIVYCQSWQYDDPVARLSAALGATPRVARYSGIGGTTPQLLVDEAAAAIMDGESDLAVIVGAEALDTRRRMKKAGDRPAWSFPEVERSPFPFEAPFHPAEVAHEVFQAYTTFALRDIARRARVGASPDEHRSRLGELFAPMTKVAAANPYAWFPTERTARELATATPQNRMVAYPYTKMLMSVMDVDLAGAVVLASHERADALGVPDDQRVYLRGWCYATDPVYVAEHDDLTRSPAMAATAAEALGCAGVGIDDVAHMDLYSCFPSSVQFALDALGLAPDESRAPFTVTGGLPYAGGAGSCYLTHAIAAMASVLRDDPGSYGLVTGVGMHMTKHVAAVWSTTPGPVVRPDEREVQSRLDAVAPRPIIDRHVGSATIAAYTVHHGRDGQPTDGLIVCDLEGGARSYGKVRDPDQLDAMVAEEWVGRAVRLVDGGDNINVVDGEAAGP
jgi:acetyl-CoA C-acetyltransferase